MHGDAYLLQKNCKYRLNEILRQVKPNSTAEKSCRN